MGNKIFVLFLFLYFFALPSPTFAASNCVVTLSSSSMTTTGATTLTYSGQSSTPGDIDLLLVQWPGGATINPAPGVPTTYLDQTYYKLASCPTSNPSCQIEVKSLPKGDYYFFCQSTINNNYCSGNPFCSATGVGGLQDCLKNKFPICSSSDHVPLQVTTDCQNGEKDSSCFTVTTQDIDKQIVEDINLLLQKNPIETISGLANQTVGTIYGDNSLTTDQKVQKVLELVCGPEPKYVASPDNSQAIASWRGCAYAMDYMFFAYHSWKNEPAMTNAYVYRSIFDTDSLVATSDLPPLHGLAGKQYRLGNTDFTKYYVTDAGAGVWSGLGWLRHQNLIYQTYCTTLETPYDPGGNCKTIDLFARVRGVMQHVLTTTANYRDVRSDPNFLGRSAAGRAVAATLIGDANTLNQSLADASYIFQIFGKSPISRPPAAFGWSDFYQHLQTGLSINKWILPETAKSLVPIWSDTYFNSYFDPNHPMVDIVHNSYRPKSVSFFRDLANGQTQLQFFSTCQASTLDKAFYINPSGRTVGLRGESVSDALLTIAPGLYQLLLQTNQPRLAQTVLNNAYDSALALKHNLLENWNWQEENCNPAQGFGGNPKNHLQSTLREFAYLYFVHIGLIKESYGNFLVPLPGDFNLDGHVNLADYAILIASYGTTYTIFDYNNLISNYGK